ncbi:MAG: cellulase family glycosylhydrolase [Clostridiales bacterium]|nr:cellulase family glycosylhydrolase [Candidatus Blautia equi]
MKKQMKKISVVFITMLFMMLFSGAAVHAATPYAANGQLSISNGKVVNKNGKAFVIKGVSTHGLAWYPGYVNKNAFKELRDQWGVNTIRLALYTAEYNGYCTGGNQKELKKLIDNGVKYATDLGMYVIIDWHILSDGNPLTYKTQSNAFFKEIAKKYSSYGNVMYEICNEPNGSGGSWKNIKSYANTIVKTIRSVNKKAIIIVGTPTWSQDVDQAAASQITGYSNIAYSFHFYAGTHQDSYRKKLEAALKKKLPVIVTEFGITNASGNGSVNKSQGDKWMALLDKYSVGRVCWNLSNKNESSALIKSSVSAKYGWKYANLSDQGKWLVAAYKGKLATAAPTPTPKPAASKTATSTGSVTVKATLTKENSWKSGSKYYTQYKLVLKNTGSKTCSQWNVAATFGENVKLQSSWCAAYTVSGKKLTIKPLDWNGTLKKNGTTEVGFIVESSKAQTVSALAITAK